MVFPQSVMSERRKFDIIEKNIDELSRRSKITSEQRELYLTLMCESICSEYNSSSIQSLYDIFKSKIKNVSVSDKLVFCHKLCEISGFKSFSDIMPFAEAENHVAAGSHGKIAFIRNTYNNLAYEKLSSAVPHSKAIHLSNFEECCEAVSEGQCEFTILPLEDTASGKMFGFYSLIDRYELNICAVCKIENENASNIIQYALIGRNYISVSIDKIKKHTVKRFDFCLSGKVDDSALNILDAAAQSFAELRGISSIPLPYDDTALRSYYSFKIKGSKELLTLLMYLWLEFPAYTPVGIYYEI